MKEEAIIDQITTAICESDLDMLTKLRVTGIISTIVAQNEPSENIN